MSCAAAGAAPAASRIRRVQSSSAAADRSRRPTRRLQHRALLPVDATRRSAYRIGGRHIIRRRPYEYTEGLASMTYHLAVDIGGTFTDLVAVDDDIGRVRVTKAASSADDPIVRRPRRHRQGRDPARRLDRFVHGTTVTTNALIERRGTRVAFVTNRGFRDVIFIQNAQPARPVQPRVGQAAAAGRIATTAWRSAAASTAAGASRVPSTTPTSTRSIAHLRSEGIRSRRRSRCSSRTSTRRTSCELARAAAGGAAGPRRLAVARGVSALARERPRAHDDRRRLSEADVRRVRRATCRTGSTAAGSPARVLLMK